MSQPQAPPPIPRPETSRPNCLLIGCILTACVALVLIAGVVMLAVKLKHSFEKLVENWTDTVPLELPEVMLSPEEAQALQQRVSAFREAINSNAETAPLVLSSRDINFLLEHDPEWRLPQGRCYLTIEEEQIMGQVSLPLGALSEVGLPGIWGRYLNGEATFRVLLSGGILAVHVDALQVKGKPIPEQLMAALRDANLAEDFNTSPDGRALAAKIESIEVRDGHITITPKSQTP